MYFYSSKGIKRKLKYCRILKKKVFKKLLLLQQEVSVSEPVFLLDQTSVFAKQFDQIFVDIYYLIKR